MKALTAALIAIAMGALSNSCAADETIVFLRHGEKPAAGLGQLDCQGLQRAMHLPAVLKQTFGKPTAIFAPNPSVKKDDSGVSYDYVRPLATIEPTAVVFSLPVNTDFGFKDTAGLLKALTAPQYVDGVIFVAWEHHLALSAVKDLLKQYGADSTQVPKWKSDDFDSLYVVHLTPQANGGKQASFELKHQGLNDLPKTCPGSTASE